MPERFCDTPENRNKANQLNIRPRNKDLLNSLVCQQKCTHYEVAEKDRVNTEFYCLEQTSGFTLTYTPMYSFLCGQPQRDCRGWTTDCTPICALECPGAYDVMWYETASKPAPFARMKP